MARFTPKVGDLVYFRWMDHCSYHGSAWRPLSEIKALLDELPSLCETTGFVIGITRDTITTVAHVTTNGGNDGEDGSHVATRMRNAIVSGKIIKRFK